jgi:ABC-2 type transport system ATP-binding protein
MEEAEELCDRISIIDGGRIIATGTSAELKEKTGLKAVLNLRVDKDVTEASRLLREGYKINKIIIDEDRLRIFLDDPYTKSPDIINFLFDKGFKVPYMEISPPTLEDVFISLTGKRLME